MLQMQSSADAATRNKRKVILAFSITCLLLVLAYAAVGLIEHFSSEKNTSGAQQYIFHVPDFEENIFTDAIYMDYNRGITFCDGSVSILLDDSEYHTYDADISFLVSYIYAIINGDTETHNSCFSEQYYTQNEPHNEFTMQKLYNIVLTRTEKQAVTDENGEHMICGYNVEYMIRHNNGTFRNDLGSDSIRTQYLVLSNREGDWKIDLIRTYS